MAILTIGGQAMPAPAELRVEMIEVGSGGERSASGRLVADRVAVKRKLKLKWSALSGEALAKLLSAADGFFTAAYPDPATGESRSATFYANARAMGAMRLDGETAVWSDVSMEWLEK